MVWSMESHIEIHPTIVAIVESREAKNEKSKQQTLRHLIEAKAIPSGDLPSRICSSTGPIMLRDKLQSFTRKSFSNNNIGLPMVSAMCVCVYAALLI